MGLAVYNSIILDIHFPPVCYRKLLSPAVVPYSMPKATVGVTKVTLSDLSQVFPVCSQVFLSLVHHVASLDYALFESFGLISVRVR